MFFDHRCSVSNYIFLSHLICFFCIPAFKSKLIKTIYSSLFVSVKKPMMTIRRAASCVLCDSVELIKIHTQYLLGNFITFSLSLSLSYSHISFIFHSPVCQFLSKIISTISQIVLNTLTHSQNELYAGCLTAFRTTCR